MKIAIVGKGGSGKSTISWLITKYLIEKEKKVLGIDADYNMDYIFNLGIKEESIKYYLNNSEKDFYNYLGLNQKDYYIHLPTKNNLKNFYLKEKDVFTNKYSLNINNFLDVMVYGNPSKSSTLDSSRNTEYNEFLFGHRCSHAFISPLKFYLPLLDLPPNHFVIVDSVAGIDMVAYGLYLGVDCLIIIVNDTYNSLKVAQAQIRPIAETFGIPSYYLLNLNKMPSSTEAQRSSSEQVPGRNRLDPIDAKIEYIAKIEFEEGISKTYATSSYLYGTSSYLKYEEVSKKNKDQLEKLFKKLEKENFNKDLQWKRHKKWNEEFLKQLEIAKTKEFNFLPNTY